MRRGRTAPDPQLGARPRAGDPGFVSGSSERPGCRSRRSLREGGASAAWKPVTVLGPPRRNSRIRQLHLSRAAPVATAPRDARPEIPARTGLGPSGRFPTVCRPASTRSGLASRREPRGRAAVVTGCAAGEGYAPRGGRTTGVGTATHCERRGPGAGRTAGSCPDVPRRSTGPCAPKDRHGGLPLPIAGRAAEPLRRPALLDAAAA